LEDTTNQAIIDEHSVGSELWPSWQRAYDYYPEPDLIWLDADTKIRELSDCNRVDCVWQSLLEHDAGALTMGCREMSQFLRAEGAAFTSLGLVSLFAGISWELCIPYIAGTVTLIAGIVGIRKEVSRPQGA
jgi:hypothetical protein